MQMTLQALAFAALCAAGIRYQRDIRLAAGYHFVTLSPYWAAKAREVLS